MNRSITHAVCGALLLASPLAAQRPGQPRHDGMAPAGMMPMGGCPMMAATTAAPAAALRARSTLHLSSAQVARLDTLDAPLKALQARTMDSMSVTHRQLAELVRAPRFDELAARAAFDRMGRLHADMGVAMLRAQHGTAAVLTTQQRDTLEALGRTHMRAEPGMGPDMCAEMMGGRERPDKMQSKP